MPILNHGNFKFEGPYIEFASLEARIPHDEWGAPTSAEYEEHIFYRMPDTILELICRITHTYGFFDSYGYSEYNRASRIDELVAEVLSRASQVAACPLFYFTNEVVIYEQEALEPVAGEGLNVRLKRDLLDTLLYLAEQFLEVKNQGRCLAVIGL